MKKLYISLIFAVFIFSCSEDGLTVLCLTEESEFSNQLSTTSFTLKTPENWMIITDQGIDTSVGRIVNEQDTIYYDQGFLAFKDLEDVEEDKESALSFAKLQIGCVPSIVVEESTNDIGRSIRLSAYIDKSSENKELRNRLYIFDPVDEETIIKIFKSHRFK